MKYLPFVVLGFLLFSCDQEGSNALDDLPACVQDYIENADGSQKQHPIKAQRLGFKRYYWLNTGAMAFDGLEYIVDADCDTACSMGGLLPPSCDLDFDNNNWEQVWPE
ncbi:MAG: hypothetical protein AAFY71_22040 [Bacteroidota bacterium]